MQVSHSDKRLEKELERARETDYRQRRREVRGEPLLKLRHELARMASKQDKLVAAAMRQHTRFGGTDEEVKRELQCAVDDWNAYLASGDFAQTLLIQYDTDLVNQAEEIRKDYQESYFYQLYYKLYYEQNKPEELKKAMGVFERNRTRIVEVQELINKRLEEL